MTTKSERALAKSKRDLAKTIKTLDAQANADMVMYAFAGWLRATHVAQGTIDHPEVVESQRRIDAELVKLIKIGADCAALAAEGKALLSRA
jgi:hypothetical protein